MFSKNLLIIPLFLLLSDSVTSAKILNLRNISSIFSYFKEIECTALNDYKFNLSLSDEENKIVLDKIYSDKNKVFTKLRSMSLEFERKYDDADWTDIIAMIGINGFKIKPDYMVHYFFSTGKQVDNLLKKIDASIIFFKPIGQMSMYNNNASNFCAYTLSILNTFFNTLRHDSLSKLYLKFIGRMVKTEMVSIISEQNQNKINLCGKNMSFNRALWNYYHVIIMGHIKYCIMMYYKWAMDVRCENRPIEYDIEWLNLATEQAQKIINETKRTLRNVNYYVHNCDPKFDEREHSDWQIELKRMIQEVVVDENDLSTTQSCDHNCNLKLIGSKVNRKMECQEFRDCHYIDYNVDICQLSKKSRRYRWFRDSKGNVYGHNKTCENLTLLTSKSKSLDQESCGYCLCTCLIKPSKSFYVTAAISFREQVSNIKENMVISGIQFTEQDYMIQIQTMEGKLFPNSLIVNDRWNQLKNFDYNESTEEYYLININKTHTPLSLGVDYGRPEIMNLDDVIAPPGYVVTGVRFRFAGDLLKKPQLKAGPIQLQIRVTPFDFIQGKLIDLEKTHWIAPQPSIQRTELILQNPSRPKKFQINNPDSTPGQFIKFRASDLRKDAGQSTVPFFDGQILGIYEMSPLGGIGIYHRGCKGCGGYLAFRVFDFELSKFLINKF